MYNFILPIHYRNYLNTFFIKETFSTEYFSYVPITDYLENNVQLSCMLKLTFKTNLKELK